MLRFFLFLLTGSCITNSGYAQSHSDTLLRKSYNYISEKIDASEGQDVSKVYLWAYLKKAKTEKNIEEISNAYKNFIYVTTGPAQLRYADSMVNYALKVNSPELVGASYLTRGILYYGNRDYKAALDNYLIANNYIHNTENLYLKNKLKYNIGNIKFYLGFYPEAEKLFTDCKVYFKEENAMGYLSSLHSLALCYNKQRKYKAASNTSRLGLEEARRLRSADSSYFLHAQGINQFALGHYRTAIANIKDAFPALHANSDFANLIHGYYYVGKSYDILQLRDSAFVSFKIADSLITRHHFIHPDIRNNYEMLIKYSQSQGDVESQLRYINKLLELDKVIDSTYKHLSKNIYKEYDTLTLKKTKENIEAKLRQRIKTNGYLLGIIALLVACLLFYTFRSHRNKRIYKMKFDALVAKGNMAAVDGAIFKNVGEVSRDLDINPEVVVDILNKLQKFEIKAGFLRNDLTLISLAASFNTNSSYLSKIINSKKEKSFTNYINDLRVDYIIDLIKNERKYRNYTIKALANESGFKTAQHFSKAFYSRTGIYPSFFITEIKKSTDQKP